MFYNDSVQHEKPSHSDIFKLKKVKNDFNHG